MKFKSLLLVGFLTLLFFKQYSYADGPKNYKSIVIDEGLKPGSQESFLASANYCDFKKFHIHLSNPLQDIITLIQQTETKEKKYMEAAYRSLRQNFPANIELISTEKRSSSGIISYSSYIKIIRAITKQELALLEKSIEEKKLKKEFNPNKFNITELENTQDYWSFESNFMVDFEDDCELLKEFNIIISNKKKCEQPYDLKLNNKLKLKIAKINDKCKIDFKEPEEGLKIKKLTTEYSLITLAQIKSFESNASKIKNNSLDDLRKFIKDHLTFSYFKHIDNI